MKEITLRRGKGEEEVVKFLKCPNASVLDLHKLLNERSTKIKFYLEVRVLSNYLQGFKEMAVWVMIIEFIGVSIIIQRSLPINHKYLPFL